MASYLASLLCKPSLHTDFWASYSCINLLTSTLPTEPLSHCPQIEASLAPERKFGRLRIPRHSQGHRVDGKETLTGPHCWQAAREASGMLISWTPCWDGLCRDAAALSDPDKLTGSLDLGEAVWCLWCPMRCSFINPEPLPDLPPYSWQWPEVPMAPVNWIKNNSSWGLLLRQRGE